MTTLSLNNRSLLHSVSAKVPEGDDLSKEIEEMFAIMESGGYTTGAGLAANQIGLDKRVIVMAVDGNNHAIINPVITRRLGRLAPSLEGCLSFPHKRYKMFRHKSITIEGFDMWWNPIKRKFKGFAAFVAQHEVDHLNGVTIAD